MAITLNKEEEEAILAMALDLDGVPLKPIRCYILPNERLQIYSGVVESLTVENAGNIVAVVCELGSSEVIETLIDRQTGEHLKLEDPIMYTEVSIPCLVEAQFVVDGEWVLSRGTLSGIESEKECLFSKYAETIKQDPPSCLATLRRLIQSGPITTVYSGGGNGKYVASHEGFALRMPSADIPQWQQLNDKGEMVDIPRPAIALRYWEASSGKYVSVDPTLTGAPSSPEAVDEWFVDVVRKLKSSDYVGSDVLNSLATSERTVSVEPSFEVEGSFSNRWTDLVVSTEVNASM